MTQTSNIETNRLVLRPFSESDAPDVFESCKNPNLGNNAGWKPHETIEETIDVLNAIFIGKEGVWAIVSKETKQVWLHWHHSRSKAGESACPHAGILAG